MPITLNHSNIAVQYETGSNYIIETVKSDLYLRDSRTGISSNLTNEPTIIASTTTITETLRSFVHSGGAEAQTTHTITIGRDTICDILIVGGGGGGGFHTGGGGGAGGYYYQTNITIPAGTYTINVGKGGNAGPDNNTRGSNGGDTTFYGITAKGGGGGASDNAPSGNNGGSGGGADWNGTAGLDTDTNTEGNDGGTPINIVGEYYGSGGGGAGSTGFTNGNGGSGKSNSITGTNTFYAAGGGGGRNQGTNWSGIGGSGIGGNGGNGTIAGTSGLNGTGSGGGGGGFITGGSAGSGGSGIVIIRFKSIVGTGILDGITHKRLNFAYTPNYPSIQADNTNLKAWYKFDGNYNDSSPSGFNLTNSGAVIVDGLIVQSVSTDASDFLETSGINLNGKTYSISFWLKFNTTPGNVFIFSQSSSYSPGLTVVFQTEGNRFRFSHYGSGNDMDTIGYDIATIIGTSWHHYVITYNNTNIGAEIWVDGVKWNTNISTLTNRFTGGGNFMIAKWQSNPTLSVNGLFEDFRYYDKILTSAEISQLYNIPTTNQYTVNFPVPTLADINNNSNIILRGAYDIALSTSNASIIPKANQYIPKPTTFTNYSIERMYPPVRNFTAATTTISGQTYGNGTYVVSYSSTFGSSYDPFKCFNTSDVVGGAWEINRYSSTGVFNSTSFIVSGYLGDWLKIQLPVAIRLTRFSILQRIVATNSSPKDFKIYGSNDNITWVELVNKTDAVYNASYIYEQTTPEITNAYTYYGLVVNKVFSPNTQLNFDEWYIYGQELLPSSLSLRYHLLNPILDPIGAQWTYSSNNTNVYHMGSVGIGTTNPEYSLDVSGSLNAKMLMYDLSLRLSVGMIAQVQHLTYTKMEVKDNTGWDAINEDLTSGFVIKITPKSSLSKMLVNLIVFIGTSTSADNAWWGIKLYRKIGTGNWIEITGCNGTETGSAAATAGTPVWISNNTGMVSYNDSITNASGTYLDSPNTAATVYYTAYWNQRIGDNPSVTGQMFLNRASSQNDAYRPAPSSSWTVEEIWYG